MENTCKHFIDAIIKFNDSFKFHFYVLRTFSGDFPLSPSIRLHHLPSSQHKRNFSDWNQSQNLSRLLLYQLRLCWLAKAERKKGKEAKEKAQSVRRKILSFLTFHNVPVINFIKMCKPYAVPRNVLTKHIDWISFCRKITKQNNIYVWIHRQNGKASRRP